MTGKRRYIGSYLNYSSIVHYQDSVSSSNSGHSVESRIVGKELQESQNLCQVLPVGDNDDGPFPSRVTFKRMESTLRRENFC